MAVKWQPEFEPLNESEIYNSGLHDRLSRNPNADPRLSGGDIDAQWEMAESCGDETVCGSEMTPDQNGVDEYGDAFGFDYASGEELACGVKEFEHDRHRWELDPASSEDYRERSRYVPRPAMRWRHFNHS